MFRDNNLLHSTVISRWCECEWRNWLLLRTTIYTSCHVGNILRCKGSSTARTFDIECKTHRYCCTNWCSNGWNCNHNLEFKLWYGTTLIKSHVWSINDDINHILYCRLRRYRDCHYWIVMWGIGSTRIFINFNFIAATIDCFVILELFCHDTRINHIGCCERSQRICLP